MLKKKEIHNYKKKGYLLIKNFFPIEKIYLVKKSINSLLKEKKNSKHFYFEKSKNKKMIRRIEEISEHSIAAKRILTDKKLKIIINKLIGKKNILFKDKLNLKSPGGYGFDHHIDGHFLWKDKTNNFRKGWKHYANNFLNAVVPLDSSTEANGCIQVSDLAQTRKFLGSNWETISSKLIPLTPKLKKKYRKKFTFKPISMKPGDLLLFNWKVCHFSKKNNSRNPRAIFYGTYAEIKNNKKNIRKQYYRDKIESKNPIQNKSLN